MNKKILFIGVAILLFTTFTVNIGILATCKTNFFIQCKLYNQAKSYINNYIHDDYEIVEIGLITNKKVGNYYEVFVHVRHKTKWISYNPWYYETCGYIWFNKQGNMVRDNITQKIWRKND